MSGAGLDRAYPSTPRIYPPDARYSDQTFDFMAYEFQQWVSPNRWNA